MFVVLKGILNGDTSRNEQQNKVDEDYEGDIEKPLQRKSDDQIASKYALFLLAGPMCADKHDARQYFTMIKVGCDEATPYQIVQNNCIMTTELQR